MTWMKYTVAEDAIIKEKYPLMSNQDLSNYLVSQGFPLRTPHTLSVRAIHLGIGKLGRQARTYGERYRPIEGAEAMIIKDKYPLLPNKDLADYLVSLGFVRRSTGTLAGYAVRMGITKRGNAKSGHKPLPEDGAVVEPEIAAAQDLTAPQAGIATLALTRAMTNADHSIYSLASEITRDPTARAVTPEDILEMAAVTGVPAKHAEDFIRHLDMKGVKG